jgi:hypothetical protein
MIQPKANKPERAYGLPAVTVETPSLCGNTAQTYRGKRRVDRPRRGGGRAESISVLKSNENL